MSVNLQNHMQVWCIGADEYISLPFHILCCCYFYHQYCCFLPLLVPILHLHSPHLIYHLFPCLFHHSQNVNSYHSHSVPVALPIRFNSPLATFNFVPWSKITWQIPSATERMTFYTFFVFTTTYWETFSGANLGSWK